jgi:hypothetical protein
VNRGGRVFYRLGFQSAFTGVLSVELPSIIDSGSYPSMPIGVLAAFGT